MCKKLLTSAYPLKFFIQEAFGGPPPPISELGMPSFGSQNIICNPLIPYLMINVLFLPDSRQCLFLSPFYSWCLAHN